MIYPKIPLAQTVITLCKAKNIKHIILSPGSRNAPLTIGFTHDSFFKCYSIVDERCAGFFALGIAQQTKMPVALVCSSGSALLNYYPAISEAYYSNIPLVVLSADRPKYLVGIGDGQTINQENIYKNHILYSANLKQDLKEGQTFKDNENELPIIKSIENKLEKYLGLQQSIQEQNEVEINKALNRALIQNGPVHINIPFEEPLYDRVETLSVTPQVIKPVTPEILNEDYNEFAKLWNKAKRKLILVGVNPPNTIEQQFLNKLAEDDSVIVLTETTSNLHHNSFFPSIDKLIAPLTDTEFEQLKPDILLTFGGLVVSKKIKRFLRDYQPKEHWHVGETRANDTFYVLSKHFIMSENYFFNHFFKYIKATDSTYNKYWQSVMLTRRTKHEEYIKQIPFSDFKVFNIVLKTIPNNRLLQVGNSSAIRYLQLFDINKTVEVFCNRGTSGIDGSTSTAIGAAIVSSKQTVFITGDLSFFYDSNALWNNYIPKNFRIIIINNSGGGIFRILPGHKNTENFDTYFETKHDLNASHLCEMFGFEYLKANTERNLLTSLHDFYEDSNKPKLLEVFTPSEVNDSILLDYFKVIK